MTSRPAVRTSLGGRAAQGSPMLVTWWLVGVNAVVYALQWLGQAAGVSLLQMFAYAPVTTTSEPWRMLTSGFLHSMSSRCMLMRTPSVIARLSETELLRDGVFITAVCRCGPLPLAR